MRNSLTRDQRGHVFVASHDHGTDMVTGAQITEYIRRAVATDTTLRVETINGAPVMWVHRGPVIAWASGWQA